MILAEFEHTDEGLAFLFNNPIVFVIIAAILWWVSLQIWPEKKCPRCKGTGYRNGLIGVRRCGMCTGSGLTPRMFSGK